LFWLSDLECGFVNFMPPRRRIDRTGELAREYATEDHQQYRMEYSDPHAEIEPVEQEIAVVRRTLAVLCEEGILPHTRYDHQKLLAHRRAVAESFEIPWTAITHRMQRLIYAINAIVQPKQMIAAGIFCGNTFISNAGAAAGPGACYKAKDLLGVEIVPQEAERAERNVRRIDPTGVAHIVADDAVKVVGEYPHPIGLLYLDADGTDDRGKGVYLDIVQAGLDRLGRGSVILAHNSFNCAEGLGEYLAFVRDPANCRASVNVLIDPEGLEVSLR